MTSVRPAPPDVVDDGGAPARRAVIRWAWRLYRRQWRAQALVLALLTIAVAGAGGGATAAYNLVPAEGNARFGTADSSLEFEEPDVGSLATDVAAAEAWFGTIEVIGRRYQPIPGLFDPVEVRSQDPNGPFGSPMLMLMEGRYPSAAGEVGITDGAAAVFEVGMGDTLHVDGGATTVVGMVENPSDLSDEFVLVAPSEAKPPQAVTILVSGSDDQLQSFRPPSGAFGVAVGRPGNEGTVAAVGVLTVATVALLLVALIATAGFVVIAQRRLRQLGMLAAIGATEKHLRLVMLANGAVIGIIAAVVGTTVALLAWLAAAPRLEDSVGHRIARFDVPWWLIGSGIVLAVGTAIAAAWWPARAVARTPIVSALSGRPPGPLRARRSAALAGPLLVAGVASLVVAGDPREGWIAVFLVIIGTGSLILGVLATGPLAIRAVAGMATRSSVAVRLAVRDLARYQARSGAALAAVSLALGIAAAIVISTTMALYTDEAEGNLSSRQLMVRIGEIPAQDDVVGIPDRSPAEIESLDGVVQEIARSVEGGTVTPIDVAIAPDFEGLDGLPAVVLTEQIEQGLHRILTFLYVATPDLLGRYDVELDEVGPDTEVLTVEEGDLYFEPMRPELVVNSEPLVPGHTSLPGSFITPTALSDRGWESSTVAWLVESSAPITPDQFAAARGLAAGAGISVEGRTDQSDVAALRTRATAVGMLVALAILAMTVGLIRSEGRGDLRTLSATGATSSIRRTLTAATAGCLALLGALLGTAGAYVGFLAGFGSELSILWPPPILHLVVIVVCLPVIATAAAWLVSGGQPEGLARQPIE